MASIVHRRTTLDGSIGSRGSLYSLEGELEKLDRVAGHDYLPMDIFIDPRTINEHFRESSVRSRLVRTLSGRA